MSLLREQKVVVEFLGQVLVEPQALLVERDAFGRPVVGPNDGRVAATGAAAEIALLEHRNVPDASLGQFVRGGEAVHAAADDEDVVGALELRLAPHVPGLEVGNRVHLAATPPPLIPPRRGEGGFRWRERTLRSRGQGGFGWK